MLALPRGGVPVAYEVARALGAPLDIFLVRKLGVPGYEELAMGAIATGGVRVLNDHSSAVCASRTTSIDAVAAREQQELERRERLYRGGSSAARCARSDCDPGRRRPGDRSHHARRRQGAATAATRAHRRRGSDRSSRDLRAVEAEADEVICAITPEPFHAVGLWYDDFSQTTDEEVRDLLARRSEWGAGVQREYPKEEEGHAKHD